MKIVVLSFSKNLRSPLDDLIYEYKKRIASRFLVEERFLRCDEKGIESALTSFLKNCRNPFVSVLD
ncbi:MAG: hypothetical protein N3B13_02405, partial [Deltaproteobacteria bacterium]|nr:hypothetical protein [Deltaproteobacteria bacterium]